MEPLKTKSVFINQLDGGYTINLQGNNFYPVKVCVSIIEVMVAIEDFFMAVEAPQTPADLTGLPTNISTPDILQ